jgi:hypothetical protein
MSYTSNGQSAKQIINSCAIQIRTLSSKASQRECGAGLGTLGTGAHLTPYLKSKTAREKRKEDIPLHLALSKAELKGSDMT